MPRFALMTGKGILLSQLQVTAIALLAVIACTNI